MYCEKPDGRRMRNTSRDTFKAEAAILSNPMVEVVLRSTDD